MAGMKFLPIKVLLVEREEPFSIFSAEVAVESGTAAEGGVVAEGAAAPESAAVPENVAAFSSPLLSIEKAKSLPEKSERFAVYDVCVIPGSLLLERETSTIPIPVIAYGSSDLALPCYEAGASDFMREGWTRLELEARLYRLLQPAIQCGEGLLALRGLALVWKDFAAKGAETTELLSAAEAEMFRFFLAAPGRIVAPDSRYTEAATLPRGRKTRAFSMRVSRLKAKLSRLHPGLGEYIQSSRGLGYLWITR